MPVNEIKVIATGVGANVLTQEAFEALTSVIANGFQAGIAPSAGFNKVWRQSSFVAAALAQFVVDVAGVDVLDDGDVAALAVKIQAGIDARVAALASTLSSTNPVMDGVAAPGVATTAARGDHVHPTDTSRAALASPTFTGTPAAPTATLGTNSTQLATTAFVKAALDALIDAAPGALDTLNELAAALGDDPSFATTMTNALVTKVARNVSDTMTAGMYTTAVPVTISAGHATLTATAGNVFTISVTGAFILDFPAGMAGKAGMMLVLATQGATGYALTLASGYKLAAGEWSTTANAVNLLWITSDGSGTALDVVISQRGA